MTQAKTYIIGDVHGCLDMLKSLMSRIDWSPENDTLIFVGDYIDRGYDPKGVVDYILGLRRESSRVECLKGNHEAMLLNFFAGINSNFLMNGGRTTIESYGVFTLEKFETIIPADHREFYASLKLYLELDDYYIVHAGFRPAVRIESQTEEDMLWIRKPFFYSDYNFGKKVIFGHTPLKKPLVEANKIGIDTGAVYGNKLTCLELPKFIFHSVDA